MPFGCSASLRSLSYYLQFLLIPHGSYCVLHATSFITSFIALRSITSSIHFSSVQYTRCQYLCSPALPPSALRASPGTDPRLCKHATAKPFTVRPSLPAVALLSAPAGGARRQFRSYLSPLPLTARPALRADKCAARLILL